MAKQFFKDLPDTTTPLTATRLNGLLDGEEALGNIVVESIRSKNMFDGILEQGAYGYIDGAKISSTNYCRSVHKIPVIEGKTYTLSFVSTIPITFNDCGFVFFNNDTYVSGQQNTLTVTVPNGANYMVFNISAYPNTITPSDISNVQVEEGSEATNYMSYGRLFNTGSDIIVAGSTSTTTLNGNTDLDYNVSLTTPSGYRALGLVGYYIHGAYSTRLTITGAYLYNSTTAKFVGRNMGNDTATFAIDVLVLYIKM